ncbi:MAG: hypothetical protein KC478_06560 [Bacteriovoracaceae bacterium]|nr:hypothetical protein [Bacteriovoracaceae bacterium]
MWERLNKHCVQLLGAGLIATATGYAAVDRDMAQILSPNHTAPGQIVKISKTLSSKTEMPEMRLFIRTPEKRYMLVHLSTEWTLLSERLELTTGDDIIVQGPVVKTGRVTAMIAKSIQKGEKKIVLSK